MVNQRGLSGDQVAQLSAALEDLPSRFGGLQDARYHAPSLGSVRASRDVDDERVDTEYMQAHLLLESAGDLMIGLRRALSQPLLTLSPWTLARGVLEACAKAYWLLNPDVDFAEREARSLSLRWDDRRQQERMTNSAPWLFPASAHSTDRAQQIEVEAVRRGYHIHRHGRTNEVLGFGEKPLPDVTTLVNMFGFETMYRLLSGVAHHQTSSLLSAGFSTYAQQRIATRAMSAVDVLFLIHLPLEWYCYPARRFATEHGWGEEADSIFSEEFQKAGVKASMQPWTARPSENSWLGVLRQRQSK